jgi:hypothetical protein
LVGGEAGALVLFENDALELVVVGEGFVDEEDVLLELDGDLHLRGQEDQRAPVLLEQVPKIPDPLSHDLIEDVAVGVQVEQDRAGRQLVGDVQDLAGVSRGG